MYGIFLFLHILAATVWTGGHLVLACGILPGVLKNRDIEFLQRFENAFEKIGIPALIIQVLTGLHLAFRMLPDTSMWFDFNNPISRIVSIKVILLLTTIAFALDARLRIIPKLSQDNVVSLTWHIIPVTIISVLFVLAGVSFRTGWL
ncbi:copper resistance protein CopD [Endozoicomonas sp. OPT23]|nr:copper resistance protein CopD [Endozoicomonas sp. OPT23]